MKSHKIRTCSGIAILVCFSAWAAIIVWHVILYELLVKRERHRHFLGEISNEAYEAAVATAMLPSVLVASLVICLLVGLGRFAERRNQFVPVWYGVITGIIPGCIIFFGWRLVNGAVAQSSSQPRDAA